MNTYDSELSMECPIEVSVLNIIKGGTFVYPYDNTFESYMSERARQITNIAEGVGVIVVERRDIAYQHRFNFLRKDGAIAVVTLWYGKKGYRNSPVLIRTSNEEFGRWCVEICGIMPNLSQYNYTPINKETLLLHKFILNITEEIGITIVNVVQNEWAVMYYLKTDGEAIAKFCTDNSMKITKLVPYSSLGDRDTKLHQFREKFITLDNLFEEEMI